MALQYETTRLSVFEVSNEIVRTERSRLLLRIIELLTLAVVENLPPYFQNISSVTDAEIWFERMVSEGRFFVIETRGAGLTIGFLFVFAEKNREAHIGYLLGETHWGQGLGSELLKGFIELAMNEGNWVKIIGGVDKDNRASSHLLTKLGFIEQPSDDDQTVFYEYKFPQLYS